jgi:predicted Zn finger-like uncharacterized protein
MPVKAQCPYCFAVFRVAREKIGLSAKCSKCGATFRLTALPDDRPDIGSAQARAGFIEVRGPLGLPRWLLPVLGVVAFVFILGYLIYRAMLAGHIEQVGPSRDVSEKLAEARALASRGLLAVAEAKYRDARALADRLGPEGEDVCESIRQELLDVKEDAKLSLILTGFYTASGMANLPSGPPVPERHTLRAAMGMTRDPDIGEGQQAALITCSIAADKLDREAVYQDYKVTQFKADEFTAVTAEQERYKAAGFKMADTYRHGGLIIFPQWAQPEPLTIGVVFVVPVEARITRILYRDLPSSRVRGTPPPLPKPEPETPPAPEGEKTDAPAAE